MRLESTIYFRHLASPSIGRYRAPLYWAVHYGHSTAIFEETDQVLLIEAWVQRWSHRTTHPLGTDTDHGDHVRVYLDVDRSSVTR